MGELVLNQFGITDRKGQVKNPDKGFRYDVQLAGDDVVPGDCVKIKNVAGSKVIVVEKITDASDAVFGMVQYESAKANVYKAGDMLTVAGDYSLITCEANGAIEAGAKVDAVVAGAKVATATGDGIGIALTPAAVAGDLILVKLG